MSRLRTFRLPKEPNALRRLRQAFKVNQRQTAAAIGVGLDRYFSIEKGYVQPTPREVHALAQLFQTRASSLGLVARDSVRVQVKKARKSA